MTRRCAVIGHPVGHSLSPALHQAAYQVLGLDWHYGRVDVPPGGATAFLAGLDASWVGISATMPHKEEVASNGEPDEIVRLTGVANTWVRTANGPIVRNTDVSGFQRALRAHGVSSVSDAVIVGSGATARSSMVAVARLGARAVTILARNPDRAAALVELGHRLNISVATQPLDETVPSAAIAISTIPVAGSQALAGGLAGAAPVVFDAIYDPWPTPLAEAGAEEGCLVLNGLDLLAGQAVEQVRLMTGQLVTFELLRSAAAVAIAERGTPAMTGPAESADRSDGFKGGKS